jgi:hypothetical protein
MEKKGIWVQTGLFLAFIAVFAFFIWSFPDIEFSGGKTGICSSSCRISASSPYFPANTLPNLNPIPRSVCFPRR